MKISVIGTGYVGLVTASCFAFLGHEVACLDIDENKINQLKAKQIPIYEPNLDKLLENCEKNNNFPLFTTDARAAISHGEVIFIAVGTPPKADGEPNLTYLEACAKSIAEHAQDNCIIINKSTVPVGSGNWVQMIISEANPDLKFEVASNPEFLREGSALHDTLYADRIVIGTDSEPTKTKLKELYSKLINQDFNAPDFAPRPDQCREVSFIATDVTSAEMIKYSANSFLALKISFANQIANLCDLVGADVKEVMHGIGTDSRIGSKFLNAGIGWGGSCFGKDVQALIKIAEEYEFSPEILQAACKVNYRQRDLVIKKLQNELKILKGKRIGLLGLAFKPNTDDLRDAPALDIAKSLIKLGASVAATDPIAINNCKKQNPELKVHYFNDVNELVKDLDALILVTEWDEYKNLNFAEISKLVNNKLFLDGRNLYEPSAVRSHGFTYIGMGRS
jgi:UDPglucose 6-dehydrogenase